MKAMCSSPGSGKSLSFSLFLHLVQKAMLALPMWLNPAGVALTLLADLQASPMRLNPLVSHLNAYMSMSFGGLRRPQAVATEAVLENRFSFCNVVQLALVGN